MKKIPRSCSVWPCPHPGTVRGKCPGHAAEADAARNVDRARSLAVYRSGRWKKLRRVVLRDRPWCEWPGCHEAAKHVDHVIAIEDGGDPWDEDNLRPLCHPHHSRKTATVDRAKRSRG